MRRFLKILAIAIAVAVCIPIALVVRYDLLCFQSALSETQKIIQSSGKSEPTPLLALHLETAYDSTIHFHAAKILLRQSNQRGTDGLMQFFWGKLVAFHLSRPEQLSIIVSLAYMGSNRYGFRSASQAMYGKQLEQLSPGESATLVALMYAPSSYESQPERLYRHRDFILNKVKNRLP